MRFEWDDEKNRGNLAKHKVSFDTAIAVFDDPFALSIQGSRRRWRGTLADFRDD